MLSFTFCIQSNWANCSRFKIIETIKDDDSIFRIKQSLDANCQTKSPVFTNLLLHRLRRQWTRWWWRLYDNFLGLLLELFLTFRLINLVSKIQTQWQVNFKRTTSQTDICWHSYFEFWENCLNGNNALFDSRSLSFSSNDNGMKDSLNANFKISWNSSIHY